MLKNKWWYTLFLSVFGIYQSFNIFFSSQSEDEIILGGWLFNLIKSGYGKKGVSVALFLVGLFLLQISIKELRNKK